MATFTDGEENASRRCCTRDQIRTLVSSKQEQGWTFAFLGAGLDAYTESGSIGYANGAIQAWAPDGAGAGEAFASLSRRPRPAPVRRRPATSSPTRTPRPTAAGATHEPAVQ